MKKVFEIFATMMCVVIAIHAVACGSPSKQDAGKFADIWAVSASEKVLSDKNADEYAASRLEKIRIDAVRNEYENGQIIVTAKEDLSFTVEISDLVKNDDNTKVISKSNFKVYTEMYIFVEKIYHTNGASSGLYPDALMPQENAVKYGLNEVKQGQNGGAYLEFYIPKDAEAGLYVGEATVKIGDGTKAVPIEAKVYDYTLSDETTSKSLFLMTKQAMEDHEYDSSQEMYDKYLNFLGEHRLTGYPYTASLKSKEFCQKAIDFLDYGGCTILVRVIGENYNGHRTFNYAYLYDDLKKFAELSLRDNINYLEMCVFYNAQIDEPFFSNFNQGEVDYNIRYFDQLVEELQAELSQKAEFQTEFGRELVESVDKVKHLITDYKIDKGNESLHRYANSNPPMKNMDGSLFYYDGRDVTLCPKFDGMLSEQDIEDYHRLAKETGNEVWWYGCNNPNFPYPSYHIEDTLPSAMLISWMMAEYNIVGNLYWSINCWLDLGGYLEDPYHTAHLGSGANGEGVLVYPGRTYGVEGPVSSLRMEAIRDGNEDYEIIKDLQKIYAEKGEDFSAIYRLIRESLYILAEVRGNTIQFEESRRVLLSCLESAANGTGLLITELIRNESPDEGVSYDVKAKVNDGSELFFNGIKQTLDNNECCVHLSLDRAQNYISFEAKNGDEIGGFSIFVGGKQTVLKAKDYEEQVIKGDFGEKLFKDGYYELTLTKSESAKIQISRREFALINKNTEELRIYLYNDLPTDENNTYAVYVKFSKYGKVKRFSGVFQSGENVIRLDNLSKENWNRLGEIEYVEIALNGLETVKIGNMIIFDK